jgi:anti-sigma factor RsiW
MLNLTSLFKRLRIHRDLPAYVRGDLTADRRRSITAALDHDDGLYADYRRLRESSRDVESQLGALGRVETPTLNRAWSGINTSMNTGIFYRLNSAPRLTWRQRLTALMLIAIMLIPLVSGVHPVSGLQIASQPAPRAALENQTPAGDDAERIAETPWYSHNSVRAEVTPTAP